MKASRLLLLLLLVPGAAYAAGSSTIPASVNHLLTSIKALQLHYNIGLLTVLVPLAIWVFVLRRLLDLRTRLPGWNRALRLLGLPAMMLFFITAAVGYVNPLLGNWYTLFMYSVLVALVLRLHRYQPARTALLAMVPVVLYHLLDTGLAMGGYHLRQPYATYFNVWKQSNSTWVLVVLTVAFFQRRSIAKEDVRRVEEEQARQLVAAQNAELERLVAERTALLTQQADELQTALTELRATQAQLIQSEKMASLGELTAGVAHEIQNPLNFVNNFADLSAELVAELEDEQTRPEPDAGLEDELLRDLKQNLLKINQHGQRASSIVRGMLAHSRASTGERQPTDLNALADEYLRLAYHGLRAKDKTFNATLDTDFAPILPLVPAVAGDLGRVLLNLFTNAFYAVQQRQQAGEAGYVPTVGVRTRRDGDDVEVRVRDNGTGIPEAIRQKIFQPFFTTKPTGEGTGLGLSLAHDIVVQGHGGTLEVASQEGEFTEFILKVPF